MVRQHGRRVLLIDADLRGPRLHLMLGTTSGPGLVRLPAWEKRRVSIMQRGPMENLFFIPSGTGTEDPAELVGNGKLKAAAADEWSLCLTGSSSTLRRPFRFLTPACWRKPVMAF